MKAINSRLQMFFEIGFLENYAIFTGKETPTQVFSCEYCKIFKISFFCRTPLAVASEKTCVREITHYAIVLFYMCYFNDIRLYSIGILYICLGLM